MKIAAGYYRSSNDRSAGLSIESQKQEVAKYCKSRDLDLRWHYQDTEVSGARDEVSRPGLRDLMAAARERKFEVLVVYDSSRFARDSLLAAVLERDLAKVGVEVQFTVLPPSGSASHDEFLKSILRAVDTLVSKMSAEKSLQAQRNLVMGGFKAGGSAVFGYELDRRPTGDVRDGRPVTRTKLKVHPTNGPIVQTYLKLRAKGIPRQTAIERSGLPLSQPSAIAIERCALTFAGHLCWNMHGRQHPTKERPFRVMYAKPREEWVIVRDAHPALITEAEAEAILEAVGCPTRTKYRRVDRLGKTLAGGLLETPDGIKYHFDREKFYRIKKVKRFRVREVDELVRMAVAHDLQSKDVVARLVDAAQRAANDLPDHVRLAQDLKAVQSKIDRLLTLVEDGRAPESVSERLRGLETEAHAIRSKIEAAGHLEAARKNLRTFNPKLLGARWEFADRDDDRETLRETLWKIADAITLDPATGELQVRYRIEGVAERACGRRDSNPRPSGSKPDALSN